MARRCAGRCAKCSGRHHVTLCAAGSVGGLQRVEGGVGAGEGALPRVWPWGEGARERVFPFLVLQMEV